MIMIHIHNITPLLICLCPVVLQRARAFSPTAGPIVASRHRSDDFGLGPAVGRPPRHRGYGRTDSLPSSPAPIGDRPPPRRTLKKRKNKRLQRMDRVSQNILEFNDYYAQSKGQSDHEYDDDVEIRPARRRDAVEAGLDYWIDESDLEQERRRKVMARNRKPTEGSISEQKLREEVVAPYKQNWIGILSAFIVVLSAIGTSFPELLQIPVIPIPDL